MIGFSKARPDPTIAIIGGGFGGIAAGVKLKKAGIESFTIFEKSGGPGGTWWDNRYPGAEVDVNSHLYCYSFKSRDWARTHARQAELQRYLEEVVDDYGLRDHFRFNTAVERVVWDPDANGYALCASDGYGQTYRVVISAVGMLNVPSYPDWPGLDTFVGPTLHTARWEPVDLAGKRVAVVGTGSTAAQLVPAIAGEAKHVTLFQREPGWVVPKPDRDFTDEERAALRDPWAHRRERLRLFWQIEKGQMFGQIHRPGTKQNALREQQSRAYIAAAFKDRPDLASAVTPSYPYPGKRPILSKDFYPSLLRDDVDLVPFAVQSVTATGVVDVRGVEHPADVLVLATGFQPSRYLASYEVVGRTGVTLQDFWKGEPQAFVGITVPEFPNFYILYGPNTNGGEIVSHLERQSEFAVRSIKRLRRDDAARIEVRPSYYRRYNRWVQGAIAKTAWVRSNNYYKADSGRVVTQWPYGALVYGALTKLLGPPSERVTRRPSRSNGGR
jgi:cation diffusion facilitator CzcD-associated flavoprotein CzcO